MSRRSPRRHTVHTKHPRYAIERYGRGRTAPYRVAFPTAGDKYIYPHQTRRPDSSKYDLFHSQPIEADSLMTVLQINAEFASKWNEAIHLTSDYHVPVKVRFNPETAEWEVWKQKTITRPTYQFIFERAVEGRRPMRVVGEGNTIAEARKQLRGWSIYDPKEFKVVERRLLQSPYTRRVRTGRRAVTIPPRQ